MSILMLNSNKIIAQNDSIPTYSAFGIFDKITDRFGQNIYWRDLKVNPLTDSSRFVLNEGVFQLHFYPGSGFELTNDPTHIERRAVIEELFNIANTVWGGQLNNEKIIVRFLPMPQSITFGQDHPLLASSYYVIPKFTANFSEASDCIIAQYIQSSENPYQTLGDFNTKLRIASNDLQFSHLDFYCNLNNYDVNTNLQAATIATNQIDLYSVALRELLVGLGVNSLLKQTGQSISANVHQFSRWDTQLQFQNQSLITYNSTQKKYIPAALNSWLSNLPAPSTNCASLYTCAQSPYFIDGTKSVAVSHCYKQGLELNYLNETCSTDLVVLNRSWMSGTVRRKLSSTDLSVLQSLGYSLNGCFGSTTNHNDFCAQVSGDGKFTRFTSSSPNQTFLGVIEENSTQKISINTLVQSNPSITSIEYIDHIGGPSAFSLNNDSIEVSNYRKGRNILRFLLTNSSGDKLNAYAFLQLRGGGGGNGGGENCNLLCNSSFEILPEGSEPCGTVEGPFSIFEGLVAIAIDCWSAYSYSPDIMFEACTNPNLDFEEGQGNDSGGDIPINPDPNNNRIIQLFCRVWPPTFEGTDPPIEEAIQGTLATELIPGMQYEISMRIFRRDGGNPHLRIYFAEGESTAILTRIDDPAELELVTGPDFIVTAFDLDVWQTWTATFTVPSDQTNLNTIIIANEAAPGPQQRRRLFIDEVRISTIPNATFNIPQEFSCGTLITSLPSFGSPTGGTVTGPGVIGTAFSPVLAGPGTHVLTYNVTSSDGCDLTAYDHIVVHPSIHFNNAVISPTCGQACSGSITLNPSLNTTEPTLVTYLWTGPSINANNQNSINLTNLCAGTYTVTATIEGVCTRTQSFIVSSVAGPTASATTNVDLCAASGCNNSILVTTNSPNNIISWAGNLTGFNPSGLCPGIYSATVTSPQGCSVQVPVTINFTAGPNLTVANTQTLDVSSLSYNTITIASGGLLTLTTTGTNTATIGNMIEVQSGGRLRILGANLRFLPNAMIKVRPGGRAHIQGGTLSSYCPGTFWHGIEVMGNPNSSHDQVEASMINFNAQDTDGNDGQGGIRIISNATIEYARIGVRLFEGSYTINGSPTTSGGLLLTDRAIFRNNNIDIAASTINFSSLSKIQRTEFILNSSSLDQTSTLRPRVSITRNSGMLFQGCTWSNTNNSFLNGNQSQIQQLTGMFLWRSSCIVEEHTVFSTITRSKFNGFTYGFRNAVNCPDDIVIENCDFRCYRGIYGTHWQPNSTVRYCNFYNLITAPSISVEVPPAFVNPNSTNPWENSFLTSNNDPMPPNAGPAYGLYLNSCQNTIVEFNLFEIASLYEPNQRVGIYVNQCEASLIRVHNNRFNSNTFGMRCFNVNRNTTTSTSDGTIPSCNAFNTNRRHLEINSNNFNPNAGINSNIFIDLNTSRSNIFQQNPNNVVSFARRILATNVGSHFLRSVLSEVFGSFNEIVVTSTGPAFFGNQECGTTLYNPTREELKQQFLIKEQEYLSYKDDGQTEYYASQIESINSTNLVMRFNELMDLSPALSTENILEVLEKEQEIPRSMLLSILLNNISSIKNGDVLSKLEALEEPLTTWEKDSINAALVTVDAKEILQQELQQRSLAYHQKLFEDYYAVRMDSTIANKDSVLQILKEEMRQLNPLRSQLLEGMKNWDWNNLSSTIEAMLSNTKEDTHEYKDLLLLSDLVNQAQLKQIVLDSVVSNYDGFARNYISTEFPLTYKMAISLNDALDSIPYHGDLEYDDQPRELRSQNSHRQSKKVELEFLIFPNPASDFVRVVSENIDFTKCDLKILDVTGRSFPAHIISRGEKDCVINLESYTSGTYFIELSSPNFTASKSLIISR